MRHPFLATSRWIVTHPAAALFGAAIVAAGAGAALTQLKFDTNFAALLPEEDPIVKEMTDLRERAGGTVDLIIAFRSEGTVNEATRLDFARKVTKKLREQTWIRRADVEFPLDFFEKRVLWLMPLDDLKELEEAIDEEVDHAKARANPFFVDLREDEKPWDRVEEIVGDKESGQDDAVLRETLTSKDNRYLFLRVKPAGSSSEMDQGKQTLTRVDAIVQSLSPEKAGLSVRYSGPLPVNQEQNDVMQRDIKVASILALGLVLLLLTGYSRRIEAPLVLGIPLITGVTITLGITALVLGQLNIVSGFLITALIGIGVDFGIHLYLRYIEHLKQGTPAREAMLGAMEGSIGGCVIAAVTTSAAFAVLVWSDFRGFREYGMIAAYGVVTTLVTTFWVLPPLALWLTRKVSAAEQTTPKRKPLFRLPFALSMLSVGVLFAAYSLVIGHRVPFHNDFKKLQGTSPAVKFATYVEESLGGSLAPAILATSSLEQAREVHEIVDQRVKDPNSAFDRVVSLGTMVPTDVAERRPILKRINKRLDEVDTSELEQLDRDKIEDFRERVRVAPWTLDDVPHVFRKLFSSVDDKLRFVLAWPRLQMDLDTRIIEWSEALEALQSDIQQRHGYRPPILDENRLAARVLSKIREDGPTLVLLAGLAVVLLLIIDFRSLRSVMEISVALALGFIWTLGMLHLFGVSINVFNVAILPTILGLGIDNAVHVAHRYKQEGPGSLAKVMSTTGSAALLASLTTAIGFGSTFRAHHLGIRSMGELALIGFGCAFAASTIFFPALVRVFERSRED